jgi:DNA processing protein
MHADDWNEESLALLRLAFVRGLGPRRAKRLLEAFGDALAAWSADACEIALRCDDEIARCVLTGTDEKACERVLRWREQAGNHLIAWNNPRYPSWLREIVDPPVVLYARGDPDRLARPGVAIVGSRNASALGRRDAFELALELSNAGLCIVSGMALGIDAAAHEGGLAGAASSIAVLGTGVDRVYPQANRALARKLEAGGCLVSDFEPGTPPLKGNFPARNRLISGLTRGVIVVEAAMESGSLVTARCALEQGRDVFALPGSIHSPLAKGCHHLIKQGAKLTERADDVLLEFDMSRAEPASVPACAAFADPVLDLMGFAPISLERLAASCELGVARIAESLSRLELEGHVALLPGGLFQRTPRNAARR